MRQIDIVDRSYELGDRLTKAEVNRIVRGGTDPKLSTLEKVARALDVGVCDLMPPGSLQKRLEVAEVGDAVLVIDTAMRSPAAGRTVAIRDPMSRTLRIMNTSSTRGRLRFTDDEGYLLGDAAMIVGEVVLRLSRSRSGTSERAVQTTPV